MDLQQILAIVIVIAAMGLVIRHYFGKKRGKAPACANCECGDKTSEVTSKSPSTDAPARRKTG